MHWQLQIDAGPPRPRAAVFDVARETLLPAIEINRGDALAFLQQGDCNMQRRGGFTRSTLLVAQHHHMGRARLPLTSLHQHAFRFPSLARLDLLYLDAV